MQCDSQSLVTPAVCQISCIPAGVQLSVLISLYCKIASVNCDPQSLVTSAVCQISCLPAGTQMAILISLSCQILNGSGGGGGGGGNAQLVTYTTGGNPAPPTNTQASALAYDPSGVGPILVWNANTQTWN